MYCGSTVSFVFMLLLASSSCDNSISGNVALFWNLYDSVVTGSRILHDVTEGVGAVSKALKAIDAFLDNNAEVQLSETVKEAIADDAIAAKEPVTSDATVKNGKTSLAETCDKSSTTCKVKPKVTDEEVPGSSKEPITAKFNGCGALGFHIKDTNLPMTKMTDCCGVHDACYGASCRSNKRDCDNKLRNCMFSVCEDKTVGKVYQKPCKAAAKLLFSGTMALSFQQYNDAQKLLKCSWKNDRHRRQR